MCHHFDLCDLPPLLMCVHNLQEEKAVLKAKAKKDEELQTRASISIPLVEEKEDDGMC